jgi:hypothetical protein
VKEVKRLRSFSSKNFSLHSISGVHTIRATSDLPDAPDQFLSDSFHAVSSNSARRFDEIYAHPRVLLNGASFATCAHIGFYICAFFGLYELLAFSIYKVIGPDKTEGNGTPTT